MMQHVARTRPMTDSAMGRVARALKVFEQRREQMARAESCNPDWNFVELRWNFQKDSEVDATASLSSQLKNEL
jgi:hypothetical protein